MSSVSRSVDRLDVTFDDDTLVANAGLVLPATLMVRLGLEALVNSKVRLAGRVGGARPGRKICSLVATILAGGTHIDHADMLRAGATQRVLPFRVMAPSTLGTFLRAFDSYPMPPRPRSCDPDPTTRTQPHQPPAVATRSCAATPDQRTAQAPPP